MNILGINSFFEHPSVAVISDGKLLFFIEDERLTKIKGGKRYTPYSVYVPFKSIYVALKYLNWSIKDIDQIAYSYSRRDHAIGTLGCLTGRRLSSLSEEISAFRCLNNFKKLLRSDYELFSYMKDRITSEDIARIPVLYFNHHMSHAASAFYCSGFKDSLIIVADGSGEDACTSLYLGKEKSLKKIKQFRIPHSLGFLYSFVTKHLGFNPFFDEYKVMGLASYGEPRYIEDFKKIIRWNEKGYKINNKQLFKLEDIFGKKRDEKDSITQKHKDIARSLQATLENILLSLLKYYQQKTGSQNLCMAGGIALNCVANGVISNARIFKNIFVQPVSSDAGTSIGAAALVNTKIYPQNPQLQYKNMFLGTEYTNDEIKKILDSLDIKYSNLDDKDLAKLVAAKIYAGAVCGLFKGRMEAGPRALGNRSVIANPSVPNMLERINHLKGREMFRPIAPIVTEEKFNSYFVGEKNEYMLFTTHAKPEIKDKINAVVHVDGTSRTQIVNEISNPFIYDIILEFEKLSGIPVIINTSLNFKGAPIVEHPLDAISSFYTTNLDFLVLENFIIEK